MTITLNDTLYNAITNAESINKTGRLKIVNIYILKELDNSYYRIIIDNKISKEDINEIQDYIYYKYNLDVEFITINK